MISTAFVRKFRNGLHAFRTAERGHVVITFALAVIPIIGFIGAAVDYSRANSAKSAMQSAVDATALMLSKDVATLTSDQTSQKATAYFNALYNHAEVAGITITPTYTTSGGSQLVVTGTGSLSTTFMKAMGYTSLNVNVSSTVKWGMSRLRVALVLDNTGSMALSNKMTSLKTASHNLLTQLQNAAGSNGDVYVSIIPFADGINVDPGNSNSSWIRWDLWNAANGSCSNHNYTTQSTCIAAGKTWNPSSKSNWDGCVTDRDQDYDTKNTAPTNVTATQFPAWQTGMSFSGTWFETCPARVMGLSYDWIALNNKINEMQPNGFTNQAIGLALGWQSLTSAPFTVPAMDSNYQYQQVIILFTDGLNTSDRWYPYGNATSEASIDARQQITCNNIKAAGITLYAVQVSTEGDPRSTLLQNCASDSSKFFFLTSSTEIANVFNQIGTNLSRLRVAK